MSLERDGCIDLEVLKKSTGYPSEARFLKGPVAVIECVQEIPCNPCETACSFGAIKIGNPITNLPELIEDACIGCGLCIPMCPGQAIFVIDKTHGDETATVSFPYEFLPLPAVGENVEAVNRAGAVVCSARVLKVSNPKRNDRTAVITIEVPKDVSEYVRGIKREGV